MQQALPAPSGLKRLMGSGDRIMLFTLPFLVVGIVLNVLFPAFFNVGGPTEALRVLSIIVLISGVTLWLWSIVLVLTRVPKGELISYGPYALVKHPLYTSVALLVLPWVGFLLNTWLGVVVGLVLYFAARRYAPEEERLLAKEFGKAWDAYCKKVLVPWL
jgi:protein-S-isoprenylcysteine O-methyltransferase Ste14